ncbi:hypothetical protein RSSM_03906 [Rhodopirellula sallentina SM41]|uniref:Uncharacterized protein n=1 Tax=Rhodopirellula sallentina SM41 TaxID=1263870 RepID=M5U030_9BACT|nr:hypothetical protein RSSM_03906 [Rhodopirellula sallentina SM41]
MVPLAPIPDALGRVLQCPDVDVIDKLNEVAEAILGGREGIR